MNLRDGSAPAQAWARWLLLSLCLLAPGLLHGVGFDATLDRDTVLVGEGATLTLSFEGGSPDSIPAPQAQPNLVIANAGNSRNISIVNGQYTSTISQTFLITANKPGDYNLPPMEARIGGRVYTSKPLKLKVLATATAEGDPQANTLVIMKVLPPKPQAFLGEALVVELRVFIREGVANAENILQTFDTFATSPLKGEGFSVVKVAHAPRNRARMGNANFLVATIATSIIPVKTGEISIGSINADLVLQLPMNQRGRDPFVDPFGMFQRYREQRISVQADPQPITILPMPKQNTPPGFSGSIGTYTLTTSANPTNVAVGDPVTLRIEISGKGGLDNIPVPAINQQNFKSYPPTTKTDSTDALGLEGTKVFEQVIVPQKADIREVPSVSFSYFDSEQKSYRTLTAPAIPLTVRPSTVFAAPSLNLTNASNPRGEPPPVKDILHIKPRPGTLKVPAEPLVTTPLFLAIQIAPVSLWLGALILRRRAHALANNPRLRRRLQVEKSVTQGLAQLRTLATGNESDAFFATVFRLLQEQLGERLDLPAAAITEAVLEERLVPASVPKSVIDSLHEMFHLCNLARYAPIRDSQELAALIPRLESTLRELQQTKL
jgi:hypothetical protein